MTYETVAGTQPDPDEQHELRTIVRRDDEGQMLHMMTEIGDGTFVAWEQCASCHHRVKVCTCKTGPVEPPYIQRWRIERLSQWSDRGVEPALPVTITERDRAKRAIMRGLLVEGYTIIAPEPKAIPEQTAAASPHIEDSLLGNEEVAASE